MADEFRTRSRQHHGRLLAEYTDALVKVATALKENTAAVGADAEVFTDDERRLYTHADWHLRVAALMLNVLSKSTAGVALPADMRASLGQPPSEPVR